MSGRRANKKGRSRYPKFSRLPHHVQDHPAFIELSAYAKEVLLFLIRGYKGELGYRVMASHRFVSDGTGQSRDRADKSIRELRDLGFIVPVRVGSMGVEGKGLGTEWRITFLPAAVIGETHDYREAWKALERNSKSRSAPRAKGWPVRKAKETGLPGDRGPRDRPSKHDPGGPGGPPHGTTLKILPGGKQ